MNVLVGIFRRYVLATNVEKSHTMTFQTRSLQAGMVEEAMAQKFTGVGDLYSMRLRKVDTMPAVWSGTHRRVHDGTCLCMHGTNPAIDCSLLPVSQTVN